MKKGAKIGLGIFLGITVLIIALVVAIAIMIFGGRDFNSIQGKYTEEEKQTVLQKLPVLAQIEQSDESGNKVKDIIYTDPVQQEVELNQGEINALLGIKGLDVSAIAKSLGADIDEYVDKLEITGVGAEVKDATLTFKVGLGDCEGLTGNVTADKFISNSVIKIKFSSKDGKLLIESFSINNISSDLIPDFLLSGMPEYSEGGSIEDYINDNYPELAKDIAKQIFAAEDIDSFEISDDALKMAGEFYQTAITDAGI